MLPDFPQASRENGTVATKTTTSTTNHKQKVAHKHMTLNMDRHLRSVVIMIEVTSCYSECTHFTWTTVRCLPLPYNGDLAKKLHLPNVIRRQRLQLSSTSHRRVAEPSCQNRRPLKLCRESLALTSAAILHTLSILAGKACCDLSNFLRTFARRR